MTDMMSELDAVQRRVGRGHVPAGDGRVVALRRRYEAEIEDVWDAITDPGRIGRWFLPISGDLRLGGRYQLEGNAGGEILRCVPPRLLAVTWVFGEDPTGADVTEVEVRLSADPDGGTLFELEHTAVVDPERWATYGPGAVGVGWDLTLLGLATHLRGEARPADPAALLGTPEARQFMTRSSEAWGAAHLASGDAGADEVAAMVANTAAAYVPPEPA